MQHGRSNFNSSCAIFYPLFKRNTFLVLTYIFMFILLFLGLILPEEIDNNQIYFIKYLCSIIPDYNHKVLHSDFPLVTAIVYLSVLMLSPVLAIILCFTKIDLEGAKKRLPNSIIQRIFLVLLVLIMCLSPYFFELHSDAGKSKFISEMIEKEKWVFLIYAEIIFITYICCWTFLVGVAAYFFKFLLRKK